MTSRRSTSSEFPHAATLTFSYRDGAAAEIVAASVSQEEGEIDGDRTAATVTRSGATVEITVTAADLVALRAGCNTWTSLVSVAEDVATQADR